MTKTSNNRVSVESMAPAHLFFEMIANQRIENLRKPGVRALIIATYCFLGSLSVFGQSTRVDSLNYKIYCTYQLSFLPDSTTTNKKSEVFRLYASNGESIFTSTNKFLQDSIMRFPSKNFEQSQQKIGFLASHRTDFNFIIHKQSCQQVQTIDKIYHNDFIYLEPVARPKWKIFRDKKVIAGYQCQKAMMTFGGRTWEAWFTSEIPISDGPYKFCGLPGLIVQVADTQQHFSFELTQLKNVNATLNYTTRGIKIEKEKYFQKLKEYKQNPIGVAEQSGVVFTSGKNDIINRVAAKSKAENNTLERFR
jgi:GLPGLI family protein